MLYTVRVGKCPVMTDESRRKIKMIPDAQMTLRSIGLPPYTDAQALRGIAAQISPNPLRWLFIMTTRIPLDRERIAEAALSLIDHTGIEKFTMRALGQQLGVDPMAIYHYLPNKEAVFDAIVEVLWRGVADADRADDGHDWQSCLFKRFCAVRSHLLTHPRAVLLLGTRPATTPALLTLIDQTLAHMNAADLPAHEAMPLMDCLAAYTVGKVLGEVSQLQQQDKVAAAVQSITPDTHPHLMQALSDGYGFAPDAQFERGLRALIGGWASRQAIGK